MRIVTVLVLLAAALCAVNPAHADWAPLGSGIGGGTNPYVWALAGYIGRLYAGGNFTTADEVPASNIASWDGTAWSPVGSGTNGPIYAMCTYNNSLIVGGNFTQAGGVNVSNIASFDGTNWSAMGAGLPSAVYSALDGTNLTPSALYVGGGAPSGVWRYDLVHNTWQAVGSGLPNEVFALCSYNNQLCAGGSFPNGIKLFDGTNWQDLGGGVSNGIVYAIRQIQSGTLVAGGAFNIAGGQPANNIAGWNSNHWATFGNGVNSYVYSVGDGSWAEYNAGFIIGGRFGNAGNLTVNRIAAWDGTAYFPFGTGMNADVTCIAAFSPPLTRAVSLVAAGYFTAAGGHPANRIAFWTDVAGVSDLAGSAIGGARVFPSPTAGACQVSYRVPAAGPVTIDIVDVTGRIVRRLLDGTRPAGSYSLTWSATDDAGRQVAPGVYIARVATGGESSAAKVILTR